MEKADEKIWKGVGRSGIHGGFFECKCCLYMDVSSGKAAGRSRQISEAEMIHRCAQAIAEGLVKNQNITPEDRELCRYGIEQGFWMLLNLATALLLSVWFHRVAEGVLFLILYIPLRRYAGGYHAKTYLKCYVLSAIMMTAVLWGMGLGSWNHFFCWICVVAAGIIIFRYAPVADENKPLSREETELYGRRVRRIFLLYVGMFLASGVIGWEMVRMEVALVALLILGTLLTGCFSMKTID